MAAACQQESQADAEGEEWLGKETFYNIERSYLVTSSLPSIFSLSLPLFVMTKALKVCIWIIKEIMPKGTILFFFWASELKWLFFPPLSPHFPPLFFLPPSSPSSLSHLPHLSFSPLSPSLLSLSPTREKKTFFKGYRNIGSQPSTGTKMITMGTKSLPWVTTDNGSESNRKREMQLPSLHKREGVRRHRLLTLRISHRYTHMQCTQWSICVLTVRWLFLEDMIPQTNSLC